MTLSDDDHSKVLSRCQWRTCSRSLKCSSLITVAQFLWKFPLKNKCNQISRWCGGRSSHSCGCGDGSHCHGDRCGHCLCSLGSVSSIGMVRVVVVVMVMMMMIMCSWSLELLERLFGEKLDFKVEVYHDLSDAEICNELFARASTDHSNFDCFVCFVLSHGVNGAIYGANGKLVQIKQITSYFRPSSCHSLCGKPKLFFIQACQGTERPSGKGLLIGQF